ncbi:MAG: DNA polymerase III subunit gamma/tau [Thermodesulfobacteriota bacterium]
MSYLVLARKSRPQTFDEVVGQRPVVKTLQNSLTRNRVAHAILFSGVRGVGKTTLARIMAKALNCEAGPAANPCDSCTSCNEIKNGTSLDLHEIDGASNRGIQEIRELKEKIKFLPTSSKYKIIIIDEVHMLTTEAFNALLKTLEEPPDHVFFMFATTELHKIPITILSRCQRYELKRISATELTDHFSKLTREEGVELDPEGLDLIVRESEGSVRDGLSLLDQVFSFGEEKISANDVIQVLGLVNRDVIFSIGSALLERNAAAAMNALEETFSYGMDLKRFCKDLLELFRTMLITKIKGCDELLDLPEQELVRTREMAKNFSVQTLQMKLNLLLKGVEELRYSGQPRLSLETCFLNIIQADDVVEISTLLKHLEQMDDGPPPPAPPSGGGQKPTGSSPSPSAQPLSVKGKTFSAAPTSPPRQSTKPPEPPKAVVKKKEVAPDNKPKPAPSLIPEDKKPAAPPTETVPEPQPPADNNPARPNPHQRDVRRDWLPFINYVKDRSVWMAQDLTRADHPRQEGNELLIHYTDAANCQLLMKKDNRLLLTQYALDFFQKELTIRFTLPDPAEEDDVDDNHSPQKQRQQLTNDPLVHMAVEIFNGQVGDIRVGPRFR